MDELLNGVSSIPSQSAAANSALSSISQSSNPAQSEIDGARIAEDFDTFLLLLTTQLQNQDPTEPLDTNEFTNQLVQFASVEQAIATNTNLETLIAQDQGAALDSAVNYVGQFVDAAGNAGALADGLATFAYELPARAGSATITITDSAGRAVFTGDGPTGSGKQRIVWDGSNSFTGAQEPNGTYFLEVNALTAEGQPMDVTTFTTGVVSGAEVIGDQVVLQVAGTNVPVSDILALRQPVQVPNNNAVAPEEPEEDTSLVDDVIDGAQDALDEII